ncbi:MAG: hypothetical protein HYR48_06295, partial [Gemmatimonadetes bacterium]|nr:hypothetical protein [Gemmatimonadota bacterium]
MRAALSVSLALVFLECVQDLVTTPEHPAFVFGVSPDSTDLNIGDTLATTFTSALTADGRQVTHRLGLTVLSGQGVVRVDSAGRLIVLARGVAKLEVRPLSAALPGDTEIVDTVTVRGVVPRIGVRSLDTLRSIGDTVLLDTIAVALTRSGVTIPGVDIQWRQAPTSGAVTVLDSTVGRVRAAADGSASFEAFVDTAEALVSVPVRQRPATLSATDTVRLYWLGQSKTATADVRDARQNAVAS